MKDKIAITGASGDIGARLLTRLHDANVACCGLVRSTSPRLARRPDLDVRQVDLTNCGEVANALVDCKILIHTALDQTPASPEVMVSNNLLLLPNLIAACRKVGINRFIHLSSIAALPPRITPAVVARNDCFSKETDWYSRTKSSTDKWLQQNATDLDLCIIRAGLVYGPYMNWTRHALTKLQGGTILLPAEIDAACYAIHVDDICDLIYALAKHPHPLPTVIYGANPEPITWSRFYEGFAKCAGLNHEPVRRRPLDALQVNIEKSSSKPSEIRRFLRWIWSCPLFPQRVKSSLPIQAIIRSIRKKSPHAIQNRYPAMNQTPEQLVWPSRFELECYLSDVLLTPAQTGAELGFVFKRPFNLGLQNSVAWWRGDIGAATP